MKTSTSVAYTALLAFVSLTSATLSFSTISQFNFSGVPL